MDWYKVGHSVGPWTISSAQRLSWGTNGDQHDHINLTKTLDAAIECPSDPNYTRATLW